ncbi:hypothetical protein SteCoe_36610 [Stentor coeruleus]|uniref:DNA-directed RNA polymerase III subunit RPC6 n=1 Tax=Stentor coeruleus TaxID=5963 RepID=A0A1R2APQ4_9CILI|nr:hypothetical protein SteCoe_36610 [Stentor coeruleus]
MEELIIKLCTQNGKLTDSRLNELIALESTLNLDLKVQALNNLASKGKIALSEESGDVIYQVLTKDQTNKMQRMEGAEILILQIVRDSNENGTWNGDIKAKTGIPIQQINKILTGLQKEGMIFSQKSVNSNKKMWFVKGVQPNNEVTGGFLFANSEFDSNLMTDLCNQIKLLLSDKSSTIREVLEYVRQQVNKNVSEENIKEVLKSMSALGEVEEQGGKYKVVNAFCNDPLVMPCFGCNLRFECRVDGVINPADCEYLNSWLDF